MFYFVLAAQNDHILWSNRSHAFYRLDRYKEALDDAEQVLRLRPDWPKVCENVPLSLSQTAFQS